MRYRNVHNLVIEGPDGVGKTTLIMGLFHHYNYRYMCYHRGELSNYIFAQKYNRPFTATQRGLPFLNIVLLRNPTELAQRIMDRGAETDDEVQFELEKVGDNKLFKKYAEEFKNDYDIYYNRAVAHHLRGEYKLAGQDYCKAIEVQPMNFEGHYNLAVLLRRVNRNQESISELQKAAILISENPRSSSVQTAYIFNLLNEVTRRFITSDAYYTEKLTDEPMGSISYTYVNGRVVADDEFDKAMLKNFSTCAGFAYFNEEEGK